jgi:hypothetical protein
MRKRDALDLDDFMVPDGGSVKVRMATMDSTQRRIAEIFAGHRPGFAQLTDAQIAQRARVRDAWIKQLNDAWRTDARKKRNDDDENDDEDENSNDRARRRGAADARMAARDAYVKRLTNAWRTPARDYENARISPPTDPGDPNENLVRQHISTETNAAAQARRDRIWEDYKNNLGNAWKQGSTDPAAATAIEQQAEQWRGGK